MASRLMVQITAPIMVISGLLLGLGLFGAWSVQRMQRTNSADLHENLGAMRAAEELEIALREMGRQINRFLITNSPAHLRKVARTRPETDIWLKKAAALALEPREKELMALAHRGYGSFFDGLDKVLRVPLYASFFDGRDKVLRVPLMADLRRDVEALEGLLVRDVLPPVHDFLDLNEEEVEENARENQGLARWLVFGLLLLGTCGAAAGLLAGYAIARGVNRSIVELSVPIRDAAGKLNEVVGPIAVSTGGGFQELEGVLRSMAGQIETVIDRLQVSQRGILRAEQLAAVGQLAAGMAHELRNPLTSIKILVQAAAERGSSPGLRGRDLAVLEEEITRLENLVQTFLDFARPPMLEKRVFDVGAVLNENLRLVSGRAGQQNVRLEARLPEETVPIEADVGQIRQVLLNLLWNALDVLPGGGTVWSEIGTETDGSGKRWLILKVADSGPGLPASLGDQIFEPFVSTKETGIGLGLSISRRIAEAHGGTIGAADRSGGGAVFTMRLPLSPADPPGMNGSSRAKPACGG